MEDNARTGQMIQGCGDGERRVLGACWRHIRSHNAKRLRSFATNCKLAFTNTVSALARVQYGTHTTAPSRETANGLPTSSPVKPIVLQYMMVKLSHSLRPQLRSTQSTTSCISISDLVVNLHPTHEHENLINTESSTSSYECAMTSFVNE